MRHLIKCFNNFFNDSWQAMLVCQLIEKCFCFGEQSVPCLFAVTTYLITFATLRGL